MVASPAPYYSNGSANGNLGETGGSRLTNTSGGSAREYRLDPPYAVATDSRNEGGERRGNSSHGSSYHSRAPEVDTLADELTKYNKSTRYSGDTYGRAPGSHGNVNVNTARVPSNTVSRMSVPTAPPGIATDYEHKSSSEDRAAVPRIKNLLSPNNIAKDETKFIPTPRTARCSKEIGCTCPDCETALAFERMLRGGDMTESPHYKSKKPAWNSDTNVDSTIDVYAEDLARKRNERMTGGSKYRDSEVRGGEKEKKDKMKERPAWNNDTATRYDDPIEVPIKVKSSNASRKATSSYPSKYDDPVEDEPGTDPASSLSNTYEYAGSHSRNNAAEDKSSLLRISVNDSNFSDPSKGRYPETVRAGQVVGGGGREETILSPNSAKMSLLKSKLKPRGRTAGTMDGDDGDGYMPYNKGDLVLVSPAGQGESNKRILNGRRQSPPDVVNTEPRRESSVPAELELHSPPRYEDKKRRESPPYQPKTPSWEEHLECDPEYQMKSELKKKKKGTPPREEWSSREKEEVAVPASKSVTQIACTRNSTCKCPYCSTGGVNSGSIPKMSYDDDMPLPVRKKNPPPSDVHSSEYLAYDAPAARSTTASKNDDAATKRVSAPSSSSSSSHGHSDYRGKKVSDSSYADSTSDYDIYRGQKGEPNSSTFKNGDPLPATVVKKSAAVSPPTFDDDDRYLAPAKAPLTKSSVPSEYPDEYDDAEESGPKRECPDCGRSFVEASFAKHVKICQKVFMKKRKVFNSQAHRAAAIIEDNGPDARAAVKKGIKNASTDHDKEDKGKSSKKAKWQMQSNQLREAMRQNRLLSQAKKDGIPLSSIPYSPDPSYDAEENDDRTECPNCHRKFNAKAAERHIPKCRDIHHKPTVLRKGGGNACGTNAVGARGR